MVIFAQQGGSSEQPQHNNQQQYQKTTCCIHSIRIQSISLRRTLLPILSQPHQSFLILFLITLDARVLFVAENVAAVATSRHRWHQTVSC